MFENKIKSIILDYIEANYSSVEVIPGECRLNYRCHRNSVHEAITRSQNQISMGFCIDGNDCFIHFVNILDGKFIDNTLGVWTNDYKYIHVKYIEESDFYGIDKIFGDYRKSMKELLPWWLKPFHVDMVV